MSPRAQSSVELLIILAVSLTILAVLIEFTSDQLSSVQKENAVRTAQQSMQTLIEGINRTYAQGPGTVSRVEVTWPPGIASESVVLSGNSIVVRVFDTDVAGSGVPVITGSLSTTPGTHLVQITAHDSNVQLGSNSLSANVTSIYLPMAQDSNQSAQIMLTNWSSDAATLTYSMSWSPTLVTTSVPSGSFSIAGNGTRALDLNAFALAGAMGNYVGALSISAAYPSSVEALSIPVNIEVFPSSSSFLTAVPNSLSFNNYSTDSNTLAFQLCNTSSTNITTISFTHSTGNAGDWVQGINTISSLTANTCRSVNVTVTPANGIPGIYSGSILIKDYTGANSLVIPLTVNIAGQSSIFSLDWNTATLNAGSIANVTARNSGSHDVIITSLTLSRWWLCDSNHSTLTGIVLDGNSVFSGSISDGNAADVNDTLLPENTSWANNSFMFNGTVDDEGEQFAALVAFSDGSSYTSSTFGNGCSADVTPPARVTDLAAESGPSPGTIRLTFTYPGDDNFSGSPVSATLKYSQVGTSGGTGDISTPDGFALGTSYPLTLMLPGGTQGSLLVSGLSVGYTYQFALSFEDEVDQNGGLSNRAVARPWNRFQYSLGHFPGSNFVHSVIGIGTQYAADANVLRISDLVTSGATDRNIVIRIVDDADSDNSWITYLYYSSSRLRRMQIWYPGNGATGIPLTAPDFDANYNIAISTPFDLNDNVLITGGWNFSGSQVSIPTTSTVYVDVFQGFSDMNIWADNGTGSIQMG